MVEQILKLCQEYIDIFPLDFFFFPSAKFDFFKMSEALDQPMTNPFPEIAHSKIMLVMQREQEDCTEIATVSHVEFSHWRFSPVHISAFFKLLLQCYLFLSVSQ